MGESDQQLADSVLRIVLLLIGALMVVERPAYLQQIFNRQYHCLPRWQKCATWVFDSERQVRHETTTNLEHIFGAS